MKIYAPNPIPRYLFLAGSIEMGTAENWQETIDLPNWTILNPRRPDWDATWDQDINNPKFKEQVDWELHGLEIAHKILIYFSPGTISPISLLELGLFHEKMLVVCPQGFQRKGNVDIVCYRYNVPQFDTLDQAIKVLAGP